MVIADSLTLAIRAIAAQRLRSFLTLLGIAVGIAAVILLTSIGEGIHRYVLAEFTQFGTNVVGVHPGKTKTGGGALSGLPSSARPLSLDDAEALKRLPNVVAVTPSVWGNAEVNGNGRVRRVSVYGVGPGMLQVFKGKVRSGQFLPEEEAGSARAPRAFSLPNSSFFSFGPSTTCARALPASSSGRNRPLLTLPLNTSSMSGPTPYTCLLYTSPSPRD